MWRILRKKTELPTADRALPGRPSPDFEIPVMHYVNGTRIQPPFPGRARAGDVRPGLLLGRRAHVLAGAGRLRDRGRLRRRATRRTRPTRRSAPARPATTRWCSWSSTRRRRRYEALLQGCSGRATTRPRACARATTSAPSTAPGIYAYDDAQQRSRRGARATAFQQALGQAGYGTITTEIARRAGVLLRRGLPPAVPRQEPRRLLRPRRHRRVLPDRARRGGGVGVRFASPFRWGGAAVLQRRRGQIPRPPHSMTPPSRYERATSPFEWGGDLILRPASACSRSRTPCPARRSGDGSRSAASPCRSRRATSPRPSSG